MTDRVRCLASHGMPADRFIELPCGCQDVVFLDGSVCYEHDHVICTQAAIESWLEGRDAA